MNSRTVHRGFGELVLIIVGVLIAFALEAWWSDREQRAAELGYLEEVRSEFRGLADQADSVAQRARLNRTRLHRLDSLLDLPSGHIPADSVLHLAAVLWQFQPFAPVIPTYEEFKSTIGLSAVSDPALRRAFFTFEAEQTIAAYFNRYLFDVSVGIWEPVLMGRIPEETASAVHRDLLPPMDELSTDLEFRNLVAERRSFEESLVTVRSDVAVAARSVIGEIDRILGRNR